MAKYDAYRNRLISSGVTKQMDVMNSTKRQAANYILNSPTLSHVTVNRTDDLIPSIASEGTLPNTRRFLFLPDTEIDLGYYVYHQGNHYLATRRNYDPIYPELQCELCNWTFPINVGQTKIDTGKTDARGRPIYETIAEIIDYPCVMDTKVYSALSNEVVALPAGAMILKMPFVEQHLVQINDNFRVRNMEYKVTEVNYENVVNSIGFVEINLQRAVNSRESNE